MNLIEANIILSILVFVYQYLFRCHIYCLGNFMEDFLYSVRIHKLILMGHFTRYFCRAEKSGKLILLLNCESRVDLQYSENTA